MEALMWVVVRADSRDASVKPASRCTTRHARITIGDAANWCGIDDSDDARASLTNSMLEKAGQARRRTLRSSFAPCVCRWDTCQTTLRKARAHLSRNPRL
jgi:hypothetical protein